MLCSAERSKSLLEQTYLEFGVTALLCTAPGGSWAAPGSFWVAPGSPGHLFCSEIRYTIEEFRGHVRIWWICVSIDKYHIKLNVEPLKFERKSLKKAIGNAYVFWWALHHWETPKSHKNRAQNGSKIGQKWSKNRHVDPPEPVDVPENASGAFGGAFWEDLGAFGEPCRLILEQF